MEPIAGDAIVETFWVRIEWKTNCADVIVGI